MTSQQLACKEAIEKLLQRVSSLEDTVCALTSYLQMELGSAAVADIIQRIEKSRNQGGEA